MTAAGYDFDDDEAGTVDVEADEVGAGEEAKPTLFYASEDEFVRKHLRYHYRRPVGRPNRANFRWQAAWWKSEEAASRIEALWRLWEKARLDGGSGMSDWWISHCDRQMAMLLSATGPYALSLDENKAGEPLPYTPPPPSFFPPDNQPPEDT
ncbi:DUF4913 domain-containing protein [Rathayibacter sp. AY1C6]|uniref:DUF4913 domain-containing protein n=1 Tax=Rathayibacter sp. AY1C6 TaxID=2080539 RepID=UPI0021583F30|nr:DUF4913 domain-containing protein [Rathayibacter sp. AY1C6]